MLIRLEVVTRPHDEIFTLDVVKAHLHLTGTGEDDYLMLLQQLCRREVEVLLRRSLLRQTLQATYELELPLWGELTGALEPVETTLEVPHPPMRSLTLVEVETAVGVFSEVAAANYALQTGIEPAVVSIYPDAFASFEYPWWVEIDRFPYVRLTYEAGYELESVPEEYQAILLRYLGDKYINREGAELSPGLVTDINALKVWRV